MRHLLSTEDRDFQVEFEACNFPPAQFNHRAHLRLAYIYLAEHDTETACRLMREVLQNFLEQKLCNSEPHILVAESFSGPLAISLAGKNFHNLKAIVLCATFVYRPICRAKIALAKIGKNIIFKYRPPKWAN